MSKPSKVDTNIDEDSDDGESDILNETLINTPVPAAATATGTKPRTTRSTILKPSSLDGALAAMTLTESEQFKAAANVGALQGQVEGLAKELAASKQETNDTFRRIEQMIASLRPPPPPGATLEQGPPQGASAAPQPTAPGGPPVADNEAQAQVAPVIHPPPRTRAKSIKDEKLPPLSAESSLMDFKTWMRAYKIEVYRSGVERYEGNDVQVAELARALGPELREELIVTGTDFDDIGSIKNLTVDHLLGIIEAYFAREEDPVAAEIAMISRRQQDGERVAAYANELRKMARQTSYSTSRDEMEKFVRTTFIYGLKNQDWRQKIRELRTDGGVFPSMKQCLDKAVGLEAAAATRRTIDRAAQPDNGKANKVSAYKAGKSFPKAPTGTPPQPTKPHTAGAPQRNVLSRRPDRPPAYRPGMALNDTTCYNCGQKGHIGKDCPKRKAAANNNVDAEDGPSNVDNAEVTSITIYSMASPLQDDPRVVCDLRRIDVQIDMSHGKEEVASGVLQGALADTGAAVNLVSMKAVKDMRDQAGKRDERFNIQRSKVVIQAANGSRIKAFGQVRACVTWQGKTVPAFFIVADIPQSILGCRLCEDLGVVAFNQGALNALATTPATATSIGGVPSDRGRLLADVEARFKAAGVRDWKAANSDVILRVFEDVFDDKERELTTMDTEPLKLKVRPDAIPYHVAGPRPVALAEQGDVKLELENMLKRRVIRPQNEPADWCCHMHYVRKKNGGIRIVSDQGKLNDAIERPVYPQTTAKMAVLQVPAGSQFFSTLDASSGYWQVPLAEESQALTTFATPWGRFAYTRATMGLAPAGDAYNMKTDEILLACGGGYSKIVDDVLCYGASRSECVENTCVVLQRCAEKGIKLGRSKAVISQESVQFAGYVVDGYGLKPDPARLAALRNFPRPQNRTDLRALFGLCEQLAEFAKAKTSALEPLRYLLSRSHPFIWTDDCERAFTRVRQELTADNRLARYDPTKACSLRVDASKLNGFGYALLQHEDDGRQLVVEVGSRRISDAETRYSIPELELCGAVWAVRKARLYLTGRRFTLVVDHQPLVGILAKDTSAVDTPRLQNLKAKLAGYQFNVIWNEGKMHKVADALSRSPVDDPEEEDELLTTNDGIVSAASVVATDDGEAFAERLRRASEEDFVSQELRKAVRTGQWRSTTPFYGRRSDVALDSSDNVLINGRFLIPDKMKLFVLGALHTGHLPADRMIEQARQVCFWSGMADDIRAHVLRCEPCNRHAPAKPMAAWPSSEAPCRPFQFVSVDLFHHGGCTFIVYVCRLSNFYEVIKLPSSNAERVGAVLMRWFATWGAPERLQSDGGPPFGSAAFARMCKMFHVEHVISSPYNARSNGHAESAGVREAKRLVRTSKFESAEYFRALIARRNSQLPSRGGCAPAKIVLGRLLRGGDLPLPADNELQTEWQKIASEKLATDRAKCVERQMSLRGASAPEFSPGDGVWVQVPATGLWEKGVVAGKHGQRSYYVEMPGGTTVWRNVRYLKRALAESEAAVSSSLPAGPPPSPVTTVTPGEAWRAVARPVIQIRNRFAALEDRAE